MCYPFISSYQSPIKLAYIYLRYYCLGGQVGDGNLVKREKPTSLSDISVPFSGSLNQRNKRVSA